MLVLPVRLAVSLQGSSLIIATILRTKDKLFTTYRQLVLGIAVFDLVNSLAYMLVGAMADAAVLASTIQLRKSDQ